jgi:hypothetical protein
MKHYTLAIEGGHEGVTKVLQSLVTREADKGIMFHCSGEFIFLCLLVPTGS